MSSRARRKLIDHATAERFISPEQHARDLNRQEMWNGQKGKGKTDGVVQRLNRLLNKSDDKYTPKVAEITDEEYRELFRAEREYAEKTSNYQPIVNYFPETDISAQANIIPTGNTGSISNNENANNFKRVAAVTASGTGGGGSNNINYSPTSNQYPPNWWDNQQAPYYYQWENTPNTYPYPSQTQQIPVKQEEKKKQEFKPEDHKGKFCAIVTLTHHGIERRGILFVKKCGHWKLCEYNGDKIAGGTAGSFENELKEGTLKITVHQTIYTDAPQETSEDDLEIF